MAGPVPKKVTPSPYAKKAPANSGGFSPGQAQPPFKNPGAKPPKPKGSQRYGKPNPVSNTKTLPYKGGGIPGLKEEVYKVPKPAVKKGK